jgi:hypothetical protein
LIPVAERWRIGCFGPYRMTNAKWPRRLGRVAFLVFLVKGLMWLAVVAAAWSLR